ncbi:MAG: hypothetical protein ACTSXP_02220 [Promethearchaeota archaeon]
MLNATQTVKAFQHAIVTGHVTTSIERNHYDLNITSCLSRDFKI